MDTPEYSWDDLLKATRAWQLHLDVQTLLQHVCRSAHELLGFEESALFLLEQQALKERATWPAELSAEGVKSRRDIAQSVIESGRAAFAQKNGSTMLCAPLTGSREILGALFIQTRDAARKLGDKEQHFFEMFSLQAAACLEHTLLYQSAITDPLTRLFCHRHFQQEVEQAVRRAARNERPVTLLLMDLDHFKKLNDTCGHNVGNECLLQVASILRSTFRCTDVVARFGGDEFEILLPDTSPDDAEGVAEKVREKIGALKFPQDRKVTATIGVAGCPENARDAQSLFLSADAALYVAKEAGRNRVVRASGITAGETTSDPSRAERLAGAPPPNTGSLPSDASPAKQMVDGHVVLKRLGVGSTAEVLLAVQPGLDREVALKRPLTTNVTAEQSQNFEQEAKLTASLTHPGIVPVFNIGRDQDTRRYYTMKPLSGLTLGNIIERRRKGDMDVLQAYTPGRLLDILLRVAETIAYAHTKNVLHLDLTPGNILVGDFGEVTVIDWASNNSSGSWRNQVGSDGVVLVGSPAFIAPELFKGGSKASSPACDVFALGTLLYYMLTDQLPFRRRSTTESVEALLKGDVVPPELATPDAGIDPGLSELAMKSLALDPVERPSAQEFANRLGLCMRHEADWTTTRFGGGEHPLFEDDWFVGQGKWRLNGDHWTSERFGDSMLYWKRPVPGSFRFLCEAWIDYPHGELGLIGHNAQHSHFGHGYFFQFGAEFNMVTKLSRHNNDVMVKLSSPLEVGRRYRLEMIYNDADGLLHCAVDGRRVFTYREMFAFSGSQIGFYAFMNGAHFRPLEVGQQNWSVKIPAIRAADRVLQSGHHEVALSFYSDIAAKVPGRLPGMEATLKSGICLAAQHKIDEARKKFRSLRGTLLEPFGIAEEAIMDADFRQPHQDPEHTLELFRDLFNRFPESQARVSVFEAAKCMRRTQFCLSGTFQRDVELQLAFRELCVQTFSPPANSQLTSHCRTAILRMILGRWEEALEHHLQFRAQLTPAQIAYIDFQATLAAVACANGREDLIPDFTESDSIFGSVDWSSLVMLHQAVRRNTIPRYLDYIKDWPMPRRTLNQFLLHLARRDVDEARRTLEERLTGGIANEDFAAAYNIGVLTADAGIDEFWEMYVHRSRTLKDRQLYMANAATGRRELQQRNFANAAEYLKDTIESPPFEYFYDNVVLKVMLGSLGYLKKWSLDDLRQAAIKSACGTRLDLIQMFLGEKEPVPGKLWPHPKWRPEWRLWLALWLEEKGRKREALDIILPSRDPRYGLTHSQPAIEAMIQRLS